VEATCDSLFAGGLTLWQPARGHGYRFNLDPVLLAHFVPPAARVLDLGTGCGVLGLSLLFLGKAEHVTGVEVQPELVRLAERNARENEMVDRFLGVGGDLREVDLGEFDAVVLNPPYYQRGAGRLPPESGRTIARHESRGTLADFVARALAHTHGPISAVVPTARAAELRRLLARGGAVRLRERQVVARAGEPPGRTLISARRGEADSTREPPLVVHAGPGREYSEEVKILLRE
jgi:tRNA1Val (adenine37-N6)-methyltransferase